MLSDPSAARHAAVGSARCALSIVHAQYLRSLARALASEDQQERTRQLGESRRPLRIAVDLLLRARALDGDAPPGAPGRDRPGRSPVRGDPACGKLTTLHLPDATPVVRPTVPANVACAAVTAAIPGAHPVDRRRSLGRVTSGRAQVLDIAPRHSEGPL